MKADQSRLGRDAKFYAPFSAAALRWLALVVICFGLAAPAHAADEERTAGQAATKHGAAKHAASNPVKSDPGRMPGDDIAEAILSRNKVSDKDNTSILMPLVGTWDYAGSFLASPKEASGTVMGFVTNEIVLGGRYMSSKSTGSLNAGREQIPLEGQELVGFDNAKKSFSFSAVDTLTTGMTVGNGKFDRQSGSPLKAGSLTESAMPGGGPTGAALIRETGRFTNPLTGVEQGFRSELIFVDAEHYKRIVWAADKSGKEAKLFDIDYTRRK
jgi:hypothetical protein